MLGYFSLSNREQAKPENKPDQRAAPGIRGGGSSFHTRHLPQCRITLAHHPDFCLDSEKIIFGLCRDIWVFERNSNKNLLLAHLEDGLRKWK
jgi:hypothetical protein